MKVGLEELYKGNVRKLQMTRSIKCDKCAGSGSKSGRKYTCEVRGGGRRAVGCCSSCCRRSTLICVQNAHRMLRTQWAGLYFVSASARLMPFW